MKSNNKKEIAYKTNLRLYLSLSLITLIGFVVFFVLAFIEKFNFKDGFLSLAGLFGGSFASVLIAWLIEYSQCRNKNEQFKNHLSYVYYDFLLIFSAEIYIQRNYMMKRGLINISDESYETFKKVFVECKDLKDLRIQVFYNRVIGVIKTIKKNDIIYPFYNKISMSLYNMHNEIMLQDLNSMFEKQNLENMEDLLKVDLDTKLTFIDSIIEFLDYNIDEKLKLEQKDKDYILAFLNARTKNKEKNYVNNIQ